MDDLADRIAAASSIALLTGAGISAAAGLPTYRGEGGLYPTKAMPPLHVRHLHKDLLPVMWVHLNRLHAAIAAAQPTAAHRAIAAYAHAHPDTTVTVITQNIDQLHTGAGPDASVIELHGNLASVRCIGRAHRHPWHVPALDTDDVPRCPDCNSRCRPDVVLFGERLDPARWKAARTAVTGADVLLVVGTSLDVHPAADLVPLAQAARTHVAVIDPAPAVVSGVQAIIGTADDVLPLLLAT